MQGKNPETIPGPAARSRKAGAKVPVWYFFESGWSGLFQDIQDRGNFF
ncbi:Uncharacterized protein dnl_32330 [Desulfonema limicola]|uniref:Uncharacterized protein n=1 Tax=Desulfonema limicola TaxID=45656 RepID=A0A975B920_9BACT|nr:Uncharacterized protein dnl_32330 [Desulfonema limicola]